MTPQGKMTVTVTRKYVPLMSDFFITSYTDTKNYQKMFFTDYYTRCGYASTKWYYGPEAAEFGFHILREDAKRPQLLRKIFENIYEYGEELLSFSKKIKSADHSKSSIDELISTFKKFSAEYQTFGVSLMGYNIQFPIEARLRELLKDKGDVDEALSFVTFPYKENIAALEQRDSFRIGLKMQEMGIKSFSNATKDIIGEIDRHISEYGWINTRGAQADPWTREELFQRIMESGPDYAEKLKHMSEHQIHTQEKSAQILKDLKIGQDTQYLVEMAKELVYFRTYRTDYLTKIFFNVKNLLQAIAAKRGDSFENVLHLRIKEIEGNERISDEELQARKEDYFVATLEPGKSIFSSKPSEIARFISDNCAEVVVTADGIKGSIANKGKARGRVKIVNGKKDMAKVEIGDVMVSPMTTPDMIPAMQRAVAFVTDEGGITCHAAIVSRELRKPCIIGTKFATKALKDGDMVEVDAEKGIVHIIR